MAINIAENPTRRFQASAVRRGIKFFVETGMQVNRAYTPTSMKRTASLFTDKQYKGGRAGLVAAHNDLAELLGEDPIQ